MSIIKKIKIFTKLVYNPNNIKLYYLTKHCLLCATHVGSVFQYNISDKQLTHLRPFCDKNDGITRFLSIYRVFFDKPFFIAVIGKRRVYCWADSIQLPERNQEPKYWYQKQLIIDICCGESSHSMQLTRDGRLFAFAGETFGQFVRKSRAAQQNPKVCDISSGGMHTVVLKDNTCVAYGWGDYSRLQLGIANERVNCIAIDALRQCGITGVCAKQINRYVPKIIEIMQSSDGDINTSATNEDNDFECRTLSLTRDKSRFGLRLDGGPENRTNLVIGSIRTSDVAYLNGVLHIVGDHILSINERNVVNGLVHHRSVAQLMSKTNTCVVSIKIGPKRFSIFV